MKKVQAYIKVNTNPWYKGSAFLITRDEYETINPENREIVYLPDIPTILTPFTDEEYAKRWWNAYFSRGTRVIEGRIRLAERTLGIYTPQELRAISPQFESDWEGVYFVFFSLIYSHERWLEIARVVGRKQMIDFYTYGDMYFGCRDFYENPTTNWPW